MNAARLHPHEERSAQSAQQQRSQAEVDLVRDRFGVEVKIRGGVRVQGSGLRARVRVLGSGLGVGLGLAEVDLGLGLALLVEDGRGTLTPRLEQLGLELAHLGRVTVRVRVRVRVRVGLGLGSVVRVGDWG